MKYSICPHCSKGTEGETRDKGVYIFVVCDKCDTILGVLPKFYQKVTWKSPTGFLEEKEVPKEKVGGGKKGGPKKR